MNKERAFLIDGSAFCYRAFYAIRSLATRQGQPTNAIYGFVTMLQKLLAEEKPDYLAVSFDVKGETFRKKAYEPYKIHRKPMPDELVSQLPVIKEVLKGYRIPIFEKEGYEADDVLATLSRKLSQEGLLVYIVTGDKDILQLVTDSVFVYHSHKEGLLYDENKVKEWYGVSPEKIIEIVGLCGDESDNIPGVPGIGEKTAVELIQKYGSLEEVLAHAEEIPGEARRKSLKTYAEQARLSRELARVDAAVPIRVTLEALRLKEPDRETLYSLFKELEFRTLLPEWAPTGDSRVCYQWVQTEKEFEQFLKALRPVKRFAFDFETTSDDAWTAEPVGVSFSWNEGEAFYIPLFEKGIRPSLFFQELKTIFEDETVQKIGQNIKYEWNLLAKKGIILKGIAFDTMVASYLLNPSKPDHTLSDIALEYLDVKKTGISGEECNVMFRLSRVLEKELRAQGLDELFEKMELPLIEVLGSMEGAGVAIDAPFLKTLSAEMEKKLGHLTKDIYRMAGAEFNINSPKQLQEILFKRLKLPILKRTKTGASTDAWVLENLAAIHPLPQALVQYRELSKLKSTYVDTLPELIHSDTQRVHASFNQAVTATGRLSSSNPNLQNIPVRTEEGRKIRKAFIPREKGWMFVSFDYSQIELRILAHLSKDETLQEAFQKGQDIHRTTASLIYGVKENHVDEAMRETAKTVNFGILYGMSPFGLSRDLGIDAAEAKHFIDAYFERYPGVKTYIEEQIVRAREAGYVSTLFHRRRPLPEIRSPNANERQLGERIAVNAPIQGTASDLMKMAMIGIHRELRSLKAKAQMVVQVHDELLFDMPEEEDPKLSPLIAEKMEKVTPLSVPIRVTVKRGKNWMEMA